MNGVINEVEDGSVEMDSVEMDFVISSNGLKAALVLLMRSNCQMNNACHVLNSMGLVHKLFN